MSEGEARQPRHRLGLCAMFAWALFSAAQDVFMGNLLQNTHPIALLVYCFSATALIFNFMQVKRLKPYLNRYKRDAKKVFVLNATSAIAWIATAYSLKLIEPALSCGIMLGLMPVLNLFINRSQKTLLSKISAVGISIGVLAMSAAVHRGASSMPGVPPLEAWIGVLCAFVGSFACVAQIEVTKSLSQKGWDEKSVLGARFLLLIVIGLVLWPEGTPALPQSIDLTMKIALLCVGGTIVPLYLAQVGIAHCDTLTVTMLSSSMPLFVFVLQAFDPRLAFSPVSLGALLFSFGFTVLGVYSRRTARERSL